MTLSKSMRAGLAIVFAVLAAGVILLGNQRQAKASDLGSTIVCLVYTDLNSFGSPIPLLSAGECNATSTPSGGGRLIVQKIVSGGTAHSSDFSIHVKQGGNEISGSPQPGSVSGTTYIGLPASSYAISETGAQTANYTADYSGCSGGTVTLADGGTATCTIINTYNSGGGGGGGGAPATGTLVVKKVVSGISIAPSLFSFKVNDGSAAAFSASGENDLTVATGTYSVAEVASTTFTTTYANSANESANCNNLAVVAGATTTCTVTNTFIAPGLGTTSDLSIVKTASGTGSVSVGDTITYAITISNAGPAGAAGVSVSDLLPSGLTYVSDDGGGKYASTTGIWSVGALESGSSTALHITATVAASAAGSSVTNSASVSDTNGDGNLSNNSDSVSVSVAPAPTGGGNTNTGGGTPAPTGGGGGGGNGPIVGTSFSGGGGNGPIPLGQVLGASTSAPQACSALISSYMRRGLHNDPAQVKLLQQFLNDTMHANLPVTGYFGPLTDAAVRKFQLQYSGDILSPWVPYGLPNAETATGYVYKTTLRKINLLYCASLSIPLPTLP